jgi:hypothetical protein
METCLKSRRALFFTRLIVETVLFGILVAIYFSVWMTVNLFVLLVSLIPGIMLDRAARKNGRENDQNPFADHSRGQHRGDRSPVFRIRRALFPVERHRLRLDYVDDSERPSAASVYSLHRGFYMMIWTYKEGLDDKHARDITFDLRAFTLARRRRGFAA